MELQNTRFKLQKKVGTLKACDSESFHPELVRFFNFIEGNPIIKSAVEEITASCPELEAGAESWNGPQGGSTLYGETHLEQAALGYWILKKVLRNVNRQGLDFLQYANLHDFDGALREFSNTYIDPLYEELDERIEDRNIVLATLLRYKHSVEWFKAEQYWKLYEDQTGSGERNLAWKLYEYLFDQGIEFAIEPSSASGAADMVQTQSSDSPLLADAKIFDPSRSKGKSYIRKGIRQVYTYTQDYRQPIGFLVVYKASQTILSLEGTGVSAGIPYFEINGKTIFVVEVDIFQQPSASVRPIAEIEPLTVDEVINDSEQLSSERTSTSLA